MRIDVALKKMPNINTMVPLLSKVFEQKLVV
jgi:hypothetical protein